MQERGIWVLDLTRAQSKVTKVSMDEKEVKLVVVVVVILVYWLHSSDNLCVFRIYSTIFGISRFGTYDRQPVFSCVWG